MQNISTTSMSGNKIDQWELNKYWEIFSGLNPSDGQLSGDKVASVLKNSQLSDGQLEKIWDLSDVDQNGMLDFEEFCICMRLIYDTINGSAVPETLPDWLIPGSKAHLVTANAAVKSGSTGAGGGGSGVDDDYYDEDAGLSSDFDWYISPANRDAYSAIYSTNTDYRGMLSFDALSELYSTLKISDLDLRSAWNLVNPKSEEKIGKDQALVFLHILNQRQQGIRVPRSVPASLRATFEKSRPEYDIHSKQSQIATSSAPPSAKSAFGESYLSRLGVTSTGRRQQGTDFSSTKGTDWEEVRLKRELADLEQMVRDAQEASARRKRGIDDYGASKAALVRRELEQMLNYKEDQLRKAETGAFAPAENLEETGQEVDLIAAQVASLREHEAKRRQELEELRAQIASV